ncbi:MAG: zinc/cadmium/mercury/lead-transporting ATPase [Candidatus Scalindua rubra]|uniref:Zinc/cadmium/mercury/lead-transporting ATPase n=1 Tax=Candidatus Scalindua rubra TaxID=1872076 RepID=A0A1E3X9F8_9BACT|nr:MAG: zinc/cadmium/mercury/lead-transporting ATPase [Candidatus Scalindua rubra]
MFTNRYLNFAYLSVIPVVFVIAISASYEIAYSGSENEEEVVLNVEGMTCGMCANAIKEELLKVEGVKDAEVSHPKAKAVVKVEADEADVDELIQAVEKAGFSASKS